MSNVTYHPYSDFALHHMGAGLADGINQGAAAPDQFRTAPLWGLGQRLFFLHDGRTSDLLQAIEDHADCGVNGHGYDRNHFQGYSSGNNCSSESNEVIGNFNRLSPSQQQDLELPALAVAWPFIAKPVRRGLVHALCNTGWQAPVKTSRLYF